MIVSRFECHLPGPVTNVVEQETNPTNGGEKRKYRVAEIMQRTPQGFSNPVNVKVWDNTVKAEIGKPLGDVVSVVVEKNEKNGVYVNRNVWGKKGADA
jgi:hypothetical protein